MRIDVQVGTADLSAQPIGHGKGVDTRCQGIGIVEQNPQCQLPGPVLMDVVFSKYVIEAVRAGDAGRQVAQAGDIGCGNADLEVIHLGPVGLSDMLHPRPEHVGISCQGIGIRAVEDAVTVAIRVVGVGT